MNEFDGADREQAARAAEGQAELLRVRRVKVELLNREAFRYWARNPSSPLEECVANAFDGNVKTVAALERYERRALSKRRRSLHKLAIAFQQIKRTPDPV
jgi:hypothetical protein